MATSRTHPPGPGAIRDVLVVPDLEKPEVRSFTTELEPWLADRVESVAVTPLSRFPAEQQERLRRREPGLRPDLAVVLGGDGAMLAVARALRRAPVSTLGINFGRVGFLASTPATHWRETLTGILAGEGVVEERMRLSFTLENAEGEARGTSVALNEAVVSRATHQRMLTVRLSVADTYVTDYRADGLILATPTGSTAYSLSAGGPILMPSMEATVVTPLSPQGLSSRPIVLDADARLTVELAFASGTTTLVVDGQTHYSMEVGDRVVVERDPVPYPLLAMPELDPYRRLRERLGWSQRLGG